MRASFCFTTAWLITSSISWSHASSPISTAYQSFSPCGKSLGSIPTGRISRNWRNENKKLHVLRGGGGGEHKHTRANTLVLFDIDGTLTAPRQRVTEDVRTFLRVLRDKISVGVVGGSDLAKAKEQLGEDYLRMVDFAFAENGLVAFKQGNSLATTNLRLHFKEQDIKRIINFCLRYIADLDIPVKRGTFIEFRNGLINVSPIGRNCNQQERDDFERYDQEHQVRRKMIKAMQEEVGDLDLTYSIGGQISFDVFPKGWDKTYCLRFVEHQGFSEIHFFGDKTSPGGNDFEIFDDKRTLGHTVSSPDDTVKMCTELFLH